MSTPRPKKVRKVFRTHGDYRVDNYFWMRDKKNPEVVDYLKEENAYSKKWFTKEKDVTKELLEELKSRIREDDSSEPYFYKGYWWGSDRKTGKEYGIFWRKKTKKSAKEVILDENKVAKGHSYSSASICAFSPDMSEFIYAHDVVADKKYDLYLATVGSSKKAELILKDVSSNVVWGKNRDVIYWVSFDEIHRPSTVWQYNLVTKEKIKLFSEEDETLFLSISKSSSEKYLIIDTGGHDGNKQYLYDLGEGDAPKQVLSFKKKTDYYIDHTERGFYLLSNRERPDGILYYCQEVAPTNLNDWAVAYKPLRENHLNDFSVHEDYLAVSEVIKGEEKIRVIPNKGRSYYIDTEGSAGGMHLGTNLEFSASRIRFRYQSMINPPQVLTHDLKTKKNKVLRTYAPAGTYRKSKYETKRIWAKSVDGTKVPITLMYRKDLFKKDGTNPCLMYGYGSYGHSIFPYFSKDILSLVDRGFVYAIAHVRGGRELGEDWYRSAKFLTKKRTFTDFIACGEQLIKSKYSSPDKLCIRGGSAGGMLMGAVTNMRPDLFAGVVAQVPFVDVINTMLDETIPLTVGEFVEWGNPKKKQYYKYMKSYSPYDNIETKAYPPMLVTEGFNDTQVHYWESAKYVAKLREYKTDNNPLLLKMDMDTGHGGKSGRYSYLDDVSHVFAFLLECVKSKK